MGVVFNITNLNIELKARYPCLKFCFVNKARLGYYLLINVLHWYISFNQALHFFLLIIIILMNSLNILRGNVKLFVFIIFYSIQNLKVYLAVALN